MAFAIQHVHIKTRDPKQTMQFYIDNLGATYVAEIPGRGHRVNLHGLTLNITTLISTQNHEQHYGIEHIALDTDDYAGTLARLRGNGARILEELPPNPNNGRRVCFVEAPDGAQIEVIEKVGAAAA
jgi:catechol 2,3-dioxygenase-like lactoylglutathione lyase family enzyme